MVCLGFEPGAGGWKAQTIPLSYDATSATFHHGNFVHWLGSSGKRTRLLLR